MKGVSVIICCHNSAARIIATLKHLWRQETNGLPFEVILVDNNCSDDTVEVATTEWRNHGRQLSFKVVEETTPGLSFARQKGIKEAKFEYAIFCDDDNWLAQDYLRLSFDTMESNPKIGILGGSSTASSKVPLPDWFEEVKSDYAVGPQSDCSSCDLNKRGYLWGSGMVLRKTIFEKILNHGIESVLSDRRGSELSSGGDSEICKWFLILGYLLWYRADLKYVHFLESERLSRDYYVKMKAKQNEAYLSFRHYDYFIGFAQLTYSQRLVAYKKAMTKTLLSSTLTLSDEIALWALYGRELSNKHMDVMLLRKLIKNISLLLSFKCYLKSR